MDTDKIPTGPGAYLWVITQHREISVPGGMDQWRDVLRYLYVGESNTLANRVSKYAAAYRAAR